MGAKSRMSYRILVVTAWLAVAVGWTTLYGQVDTKRGPSVRTSKNDEQLKRMGADSFLRIDLAGKDSLRPSCRSFV